MKPTLVRLPISHFCLKAEWALSIAGVPYDTMDVPLWKMQHVAKLHPGGTVPVLLLEDRRLTDSSDILAWLHLQAGTEPSSDELEWCQWADELGAVTRREAYRWVYNRPWSYTRNPGFWFFGLAGHRIVLRILKHYKVRRYDESDREFLAAALPKIVAGITDSGFLARQRGFADCTVAALLRPVLRIRGHALEKTPEWRTLKAYVKRVQPKLTRARRRGVRARDIEAWERGRES